MALQFTPWVIPLGATVLVTAVFGAYGVLSYRRHPDEQHLLAFAVFMFAMAGWVGLTTAQQITTSHELKLLFGNVTNAIFVPLTLYGVLWFALMYTGNTRWVNRWAVGFVTLHILVSTAVLALFPNILYTTWVVTEPGPTVFGVAFEPYVVMKRELTLAFVLLQLYGYGVLLVSGVVIGRFLLRYRENLYRGQAVAMLAAILTPVFANAMLFAGAVSPEYNLTELSFTLSGSAFAFGIFRYRLFDLVPVARDAVIEDMRDGFVVCNDENIVLDSNPAARDILGVGEASLTGRALSDVLPGIESLLQASGEQATGELRLDVQGRDRYLAVSLSQLGNDEGNDGRLVTFRDVTERHWYERELEEEREKYSTLVEQSHDGVAIIQDGDIVFINQQVERLVGCDEADILGSPFETFVAPKDREAVIDRYERRLRGEEVPNRYDIELTRPTGERRTVDLQATDIQYEGAWAVLVTLSDVTERKAYEQSLEEQNRKLELLNRLVRHDIRNDMNVIIGHTQQLEAELGTERENDRVATSLDALGTHSEHVVDVTDVVRDLMESMQRDGNQLKRVSLRSILTREVDDLRKASDSAVITTQTPIPDVDVLTDDMLGSVLRNLLKNAVAHNDSPTPEVEVSVSTDDDHVAVRIADNGPGIPDSRKADIFGKGEKGLESTGTGIGLYLVHTLVTGYGGDVWLKDNDPRGTVVTIELPRAR